MATYKYRSVTQAPTYMTHDNGGVCEVGGEVSLRDHGSASASAVWARMQEHLPAGTTITIERVVTCQFNGMVIQAPGAEWQPWTRFVVEQGGVRQVKEAKSI
jgi:hypothetical protein